MKNITETDLQDSEGRIVISPGLKVRHKNSQYEYTVDSVVQDDNKENIVILNLPEEPRFDTDKSETEPTSVLSDLESRDVIYEIDPSTMVYEPDDEVESDPVEGLDFLAVPEKEFEKDYEVK
jgi:hypothetical protein